MKNDYVLLDDIIYRIIEEEKDNYLVIDCRKKNMPVWKAKSELVNGVVIDKEEAFESLGIKINEESLTGAEYKQAHERFTMIAGILAFMKDDVMRNRAIAISVATYKTSRQSITTYLINYLITSSVSSLVNKPRKKNKKLTEDEKICDEP